jgi:MtN3 and saliva related transmembrane protein
LSIEIVGWAALVMTQVFWIPNIARILRTRDVDGYSLPAWIIMLLGLSCWLIYFAAKGDLVGVVANVSGVTGGLITTACIWYWGRKPVRSPHAQPRAMVSEALTTDQG